MATEEESCKIWVGGLPNNMDEESFRSIFEGCDVVKVSLFPERWYGFVEFSTAEEAQAIAQTLNGCEYNGRILKMDIHVDGKNAKQGAANNSWGKGASKGTSKGASKGAKPSDPDSEATSTRVWVGGLPNNMDEERFRSIFEGHDVVKVDLFPEKWYGFAEFATPEEASGVVQQYNGCEFDGRTLKIDIHTTGKNSKQGATNNSWGKGAKSSTNTWSSHEDKVVGNGSDGPASNKIWVGGLPNNMNEELFRSIFAGCDITKVDLFPHKWYGFVEFSTSEEAEAIAQMLNGCEFMGRILKMDVHTMGKNTKQDAASNSWGKSATTSTGMRSAPYSQANEEAVDAIQPEFAGACAQSQQAILIGKTPDFTKGSDTSSVHVKGLPPHADQLFLYKLFAPFGSIMSILALPGATGIVAYGSDEEATFAINRMNGQKTVDGSVLRCSLQTKIK